MNKDVLWHGANLYLPKYARFSEDCAGRFPIVAASINKPDQVPHMCWLRLTAKAFLCLETIYEQVQDMAALKAVDIDVPFELEKEGSEPIMEAWRSLSGDLYQKPRTDIMSGLGELDRELIFLLKGNSLRESVRSVFAKNFRKYIKYDTDVAALDVGVLRDEKAFADQLVEWMRAIEPDKKGAMQSSLDMACAFRGRALSADQAGAEVAMAPTLDKLNVFCRYHALPAYFDMVRMHLLSADNAYSTTIVTDYKGVQAAYDTCSANLAEDAKRQSIRRCMKSR